MHLGHAADHLGGRDLLVVSSAVRPDNPEVEAAVRCGLSVVKRARLLGWLTEQRTTVAVAGNARQDHDHGHDGYLLPRAGLDPGFMIGGEPSIFLSPTGGRRLAAGGGGR